MVITGTFRRSLDEKGRFAIPKPMRLAVTDGEDEAKKSSQLFIAPGTDGCLALFAEEAFRLLGARLEEVPPTGSDVRAFSRLFYSQAQLVEPDGQGRIRIPAELQTLAALDREVVIVGVRDHMEIWNVERWQSYLAEKQSRYDQIAEQAFRSRA